ncbi:MAG: NAD(+) synthase [Microgenomates group bacterium]
MDKVNRITSWLKQTYGERPAVIGVSGGVDSAVALSLLTRALGKDKVIPVLLPYGDQDMMDAKAIVGWNDVTNKTIEINIKEIVDTMAGQIGATVERVRVGNIMARVRMIVVFDMAKKMGALVCGTENKSEHKLGYYTRFGDSASDVEPIAGLYKTEVWEMAKEMGLPEIFYTKKPSAGLWDGQTDEGEMGFTYQQADLVLQGKSEGVEPKIVEKVKRMVEANKFKLEVPYTFDF